MRPEFNLLPPTPYPLPLTPYPPNPFIHYPYSLLPFCPRHIIAKEMAARLGQMVDQTLAMLHGSSIRYPLCPLPLPLRKKSTVELVQR